MENIHIGSVIEQRVREIGLTVQEFANKIHCHRTTVYHIFKQKSMNSERLKEISEVLEYDFVNVVFAKQETPTQKTQKIYIAVEIDKDMLQKLDLPDGFIQLITNQQEICKKI
jgi:predicted transcriptional regulator